MSSKNKMEEITDKHIDKFQGHPPIPIYLCKRKELGYGYRVFCKIRDKINGGRVGGAEYRAIFKEIRVSENISKEKMDGVIQHEINHYIQSDADPEIDWTDKAFASLLISLTASIGVQQLNPLFQHTTKIFTAVLISFLFWKTLFWDEAKADKNTVFEDMETTWKDHLLKIMVIPLIPLKTLTIAEHVIKNLTRLANKKVFSRN